MQNCLLDNADQQSASYKRETMRAVAVAANVHNDALQPLLTKVVATVCKHLKVRNFTACFVRTL